MTRQISLIVFASLLACSLLVGLVALPYVNVAHAENNPRTFGLRANLLINSDITPLVNAAQIMRLDWLAQDVQWKTIEAQPGQYRWEKLDAALNATRARDFRILLTISGTPEWAKAPGSNPAYDAPPADLNNLNKFISTLAKRYDGLISAYEIYPEANLATRWATAEGISPERYTELLKVAYTAAHTANAPVIVIGGSLAPVVTSDGKTSMDDLTFYRGMYKAGAAKYMDGLGMHVEGYNNPPQDFINANSTSLTTYKNKSAYYFRHYETIRNLMIENNDKDKSLWITSAGWASSAEKIKDREYAFEVTEDKQAEYIVEAMKQVRAQTYIAALIINNFNYSTIVNNNDPLALYSLIRADWSARPAFLKLAQARQETSGLTVGNSTPTQTHTMPNWRPRQRPLYSSGVQNGSTSP